MSLRVISVVYSICSYRRPDIMNLIEDKVENTHELIDIGKVFLNRTLITQTLRPSISGIS
jgi:hypothetical protein